MVLEKKKAVLDMVHDVNSVYLENNDKIIEFTGDAVSYATNIDIFDSDGIVLAYDSNIKLQQEIDKIVKIQNESIDDYDVKKVEVIIDSEEDEGVYEHIRLSRKIYHNTKILEIGGMGINNRDNHLTFHVSDIQTEDLFTEEELKVFESLNE